MRRADPFQLLPLLLPPERRSLLVLGWHPSLGRLLAGREDVRVLVEERARGSLELPRGATAAEPGVEVDARTTLLACGVGPGGWRGQLPWTGRVETAAFVALAPRKRAAAWREVLPRADWTLFGFPSFGSPWLWLPEGAPWPGPRALSPRGRLELPWARVDATLGRALFPSRGAALLVGGRAAPLGRILERAAPEASGPGRFWVHTRNNALVALTGADPPLVVKIPLEREGRNAMRAHHRTVEELRGSGGAESLLDLLPRRMRLLSEGGFEAGVEEAFHGVSAYRYLPRRGRLRAIQEEAARRLLEWQRSEARPLRQGPREFQELWAGPLRPLERLLRGHELRAVFASCLQRLERRVVGTTLPVVPTHGDFWVNNLIWDPARGELSGILDWDRGALRGLPLLDLFQLLFQRTRYLHALHSRWTLERTLERGFPGRTGRLIRDYARQLELPRERIEDLFCRYWLGEAAANAGFFLREREARRAMRKLGEWARR